GMETGRGWLAAILLAVAGVAGASGGGGVKLDIDPNMLTEGFLGAHPDLPGPLAVPQAGAEINAPALMAAATVLGTDCYADDYWVPEQYWKMMDRSWNAPAADREGRVDVGAPATLPRPRGSGERPDD